MTKQQQIKFLQWFIIALFCKFMLLDIIPEMMWLRSFLAYIALFKCVTYVKELKRVNFYIGAGLLLLISGFFIDSPFLAVWHFVLIGGIDLLIIIMLGQQIIRIEQQYRTKGKMSELFISYQWGVLLLLAGWTFKMNVSVSTWTFLLFVGVLVLFVVQIRLLIHTHRLKKHIRFSMQTVTFPKK
ncbi:hypothetical protein [Lysinibacillus piscis]|uniref:Uncharacterized protein n=1 Tax=Lysinibacillus piscis TaxID=2518931 RepID=A0ABQ5NEW8_9BACI|nr:hypothetical protein [Lysinibacillus sp. KH24]GLC86940.1 hypothetical protein LYSBPC_00670 [Lysinibacillus sp. KH24]